VCVLSISLEVFKLCLFFLNTLELDEILLKILMPVSCESGNETLNFTKGSLAEQLISQ
jgi:hypothetical protein